MMGCKEDESNNIEGTKVVRPINISLVPEGVGCAMIVLVIAVFVFVMCNPEVVLEKKRLFEGAGQNADIQNLEKRVKTLEDAQAQRDVEKRK